MKKLYLVILMLSASLLFAQKSQVVTIDISESATTTTYISIPIAYFISSVEFPALATGTDGAYFTNIAEKEYWYDDARYDIAFKSGGNCEYSLTPAKMYQFRGGYLVVDTDQTSDVQVIINYEKKR